MTDLNRSELSDEAKDLLLRMLRFEVSARISIDAIYDHPWYRVETTHERMRQLFADVYADVSKSRGHVSRGGLGGGKWHKGLPSLMNSVRNIFKGIGGSGSGSGGGGGGGGGKEGKREREREREREKREREREILIICRIGAQYLRGGDI